MQTVKILVADDEVIVRAFFRTVISKENLPVSVLYEADNGLEAVRIARKEHPDLIFLDIQMPGLDGLRAAEKIMHAEPNAKIIIVSAYNEFDYARTAFRAGVTDYLLKPIKPMEIAEIVKNAINTPLPELEVKGRQEPTLPAIVRAVVDYVEKNLDQQFQLQDIAKAAFVSPFHLSRTFKHLTGQSIVDYVNEKRLSKAEELLVTTDIPIIEVAGKVGFNDAAYFATCFKNKKGISPMQYRKSARK